MAHGSYGKAQHLSVKYASLIAEYSDEKSTQHDVGIQTDVYPVFSPRSDEWSESCSKSTGSSQYNEFITDSGVIPPVTTEKTLMTLDIVSTRLTRRACQNL